MTVITHALSRSAASTTSVVARHDVRPGASQRSRIEASALAPHRFPFDLTDGTITVEVSGDEPDWLYSVLDKLQSIAMLPPDWDSYGGAPLTFDAALASLYFLARFLPESAMEPSVVPSSTGGVQLEWHRHAGDLEVSFSPDGSYTAFFMDAVTGSEWEMVAGDIDAHRLAAAVNSMSAPITN